MISDRRDEIIAVVENQQRLDARTQKKLRRFIEKYFGLAGVPKNIERDFAKNEFKKTLGKG